VAGQSVGLAKNVCDQKIVLKGPKDCNPFSGTLSPFPALDGLDK